ncbi:MAG: DUF2382 domain-containing protein [Bacillota bacterium]
MADRKRASPSHPSHNSETAEEVAAIPLVEERLSVAKRQVESGRVRVHVTVEEHEEIVTEQLLHDDLQIERVPRNVRLTEVPHVRLEGNTTIVPVVEEVLVVEKALVLVEEIHICRRSVPEETQIPVTLRVERASVERDPARDTPAAAE